MNVVNLDMAAEDRLNSISARMPDWIETQMQILENTLESQVSKRTADLTMRYEREHRLVKMLEQAMMLTPPVEELPGLSVHSMSELAFSEELLGGDFCDAFMVSDHKAVLIVGDVCGKGLLAAMQIPRVKFSLRSYLHEGSSPALAIERLNHMLCSTRSWSDIGTASFVSIAIVVLDTRTGEGVCCLAGAEAPVVLREHGAPETIGEWAMPVAIDRLELEYEDAEFTLGQEDILVMATDGITESGRGGTQLGDVDMMQVALQAWLASGNSQAHVAEAIFDAARAYDGGAMRDDATVLTAKLKQI